MATTNEATFSKLRTGEWGIRSTAALKAGDAVTVIKRSGERKQVAVGRVVFARNGVTLATIAQAARVAPAAHSHGRRRLDGTYECDECGEFVRPGTECWETGLRH